MIFCKASNENIIKYIMYLFYYQQNVINSSGGRNAWKGALENQPNKSGTLILFYPFMYLVCFSMVIIHF